MLIFICRPGEAERIRQGSWTRSGGREFLSAAPPAQGGMVSAYKEEAEERETAEEAFLQA